MWIYRMLLLAQPNGTPPPDKILSRMFGPVPRTNDPKAGGLGISPVDFMGNVKQTYWRGSYPQELVGCNFG
jgi:hypothetical protein